MHTRYNYATACVVLLGIMLNPSAIELKDCLRVFIHECLCMKRRVRKLFE